ncbi:helix-turn-helix domain-containing protein [Candidatus Poribacteria bacterium]|jgi:excisionase family DNA binding protein|nr:helix-turn-helix domain-containing protein [Candidatus Poribacteria bacterium]MBT5710964.1 helix-turn-helix domain-containing protein [Candidatus Poribacteria bacterium]MBT7808190.1 helix-turn-helix domain-containing protein [Candidatus Poribacteria bacterium]
MVGNERFLNVDDVAALFGVSPKTVYGWVHAKAIPHMKLSRSVLRFRPSDIEAWAESRAVAVGAKGGHEAESNRTNQ